MSHLHNHNQSDALDEIGERAFYIMFMLKTLTFTLEFHNHLRLQVQL